MKIKNVPFAPSEQASQGGKKKMLVRKTGGPTKTGKDFIKRPGPRRRRWPVVPQKGEGRITREKRGSQPSVRARRGRGKGKERTREVHHNPTDSRGVDFPQGREKTKKKEKRGERKK